MSIFGKKKDKGFFSYLKELFSSNKEINPEFQENLKRILYKADLGPSIVEGLFNKLKNIKTYEEASSIIQNELSKVLKPYESEISVDKKPFVIMMVGVNGVGKTTAAAKLAYWFKETNNKKVMLVAGDTFRAAAVEQLEHWAKKIGCEFFSKSQNADPGSVGYESVTMAIKNDIDVLIIDTGGRLHTQRGLMAEISKVYKAVSKALNHNPDQVLLVVDATQGQNIQNQVEIFNNFIEISGIILAKVDGTAKGGAVIKAIEKLKRPLFFLGTGEKLTDLARFESQGFIAKLL
ncbi:MAG: signal recognition particle-docking protein FtsY [Proteobacteria bacterium]|nr:signal recognition particle-docking protein FtsY [Pseudomonadota bacterium]